MEILIAVMTEVIVNVAIVILIALISASAGPLHDYVAQYLPIASDYVCDKVTGGWNWVSSRFPKHIPRIAINVSFAWV